jgi:hypothetical protein
MRTVHEERPKSAAARRIPEDKFEYLLVEVTQDGINAGIDKVSLLEKDGWEVVPKNPNDRYTCKSQIKMRIDRNELANLRQKRIASTFSSTSAPGDRPDPKGSKIKLIESGPDSLTDEEQRAISSIVASANS